MRRSIRVGQADGAGRIDPETIPLSRALIDAICHDHPFEIPWPQLHWPP
jgi:hypothetical protein